VEEAQALCSESEERGLGGGGETFISREDLLVGLLVVAVSLHDVGATHTDLALLPRGNLELEMNGGEA
jgi:hypothetical protein